MSFKIIATEITIRHRTMEVFVEDIGAYEEVATSNSQEEDAKAVATPNKGSEGSKATGDIIHTPDVFEQMARNHHRQAQKSDKQPSLQRASRNPARRIKDKIRAIFKAFLENVIRDIITFGRQEQQTTVTATDVADALRRCANRT